MTDLTSIRVLITGDAEADVDFIGERLAESHQIARGVPAAIASMRLADFGVLVADVTGVHDALALLRAARRGRPPTRAIVLIPADEDEGGAGWELVAGAAFVVLRHPVRPGDLQAMIDAARAEYARALDGAATARLPVSESPEDTRWLLAERRLASVLRALVTQRVAVSVDHRVESIVAHGVQAMTVATREGDGGPELLLVIADALNEHIGPGRKGAGEAA